ncbi:MAG: hypothetical protein JSR21_01450 [Proteobacteria bacterium]|nr:hypothetical protein [Pseudomonadota bacterium]
MHRQDHPHRACARLGIQPGEGVGESGKPVALGDDDIDLQAHRKQAHRLQQARPDQRREARPLAVQQRAGRNRNEHAIQRPARAVAGEKRHRAPPGVARRSVAAAGRVVVLDRRADQQRLVGEPPARAVPLHRDAAPAELPLQRHGEMRMRDERRFARLTGTDQKVPGKRIGEVRIEAPADALAAQDVERLAELFPEVLETVASVWGVPPGLLQSIEQAGVRAPPKPEQQRLAAQPKRQDPGNSQQPPLQRGHDRAEQPGSEQADQDACGDDAKDHGGAPRSQKRAQELLHRPFGLTGAEISRIAAATDSALFRTL